MRDRRVVVHPDHAALSDAVANAIAQAARECAAARGRFTLVLSGGETPRGAYELLAARYAQDIPWDRTEVFFSDERFVPPADARNNYAMARAALLSRVPLPAERVHPIPTVGGSASDCAERYEATLRARLPDSEDRPDAPTFDVALLGVGADGHTASLFPGDAALREPARWALAVDAPGGTEVRTRITLSLPALNRARQVLFMVSGAGKKNAVARALRGELLQGVEPLPAALVRGIEGTVWSLDTAAAPERVIDR